MSLTPTHSAQKARAFTLIELLTVIAIIGILAAIIIPTVGKVRDTAKTANCVSNLRQVGMALRFYVDDNKGYFPLPILNQPGDTTWHQEIERYLPNRTKDATTWYSGHHPVMQCPSIKWPGVNAGESGACYSMVGAAMGLAGTASTNSAKRSYATIRTPSQAPWLIDGAPNGTGATTKFYAKYWVSRNSIASDASGTTNVNSDWRHGDRMNMGFADGSVRAMNRTEFLVTFPDNIKFNGLE